MSKQHFIYKITNNINKRFYIGMHSGFEDDGYFGSGRRLKSEVKKYGRGNFVKEILEVCSDRKKLEQREAAIVNDALLSNPFCLNLKNGGEGGGKFCSEEHQRKCSSAGGLANGSRTAWVRNKEKMTQAVSNELKRRHSLGLVNYATATGSCWVNNKLKSFRIKKADLDSYLADGYFKGRKI